LNLLNLDIPDVPAALLRGFKAIYLGGFMNVLIMGWVNVAMITLLQGFFG